MQTVNVRFFTLHIKFEIPTSRNTLYHLNYNVNSVWHKSLLQIDINVELKQRCAIFDTYFCRFMSFFITEHPAHLSVMDRYDDKSEILKPISNLIYKMNTSLNYTLLCTWYTSYLSIIFWRMTYCVYYVLITTTGLKNQCHIDVSCIKSLIYARRLSFQFYHLETW